MKKNLVGLIADTHDNRENIKKAVEIFNNKGVSLVIHAGDLIAPFTCLDFKELKVPMEIVFGNNDGERVGLTNAYKDIGTILPGPRTFLFNGKRFLLMHEPGCLDELIKGSTIDVIIYGHTHEVDLREGQPLIVNPGEAGGWLKGTPTIGILDLDEMSVEIIKLNL